MTIVDAQELRKVASSRAKETFEKFLKDSPLTVDKRKAYETMRDALEGSYVSGYEEGYTDALRRVMKDTK